ncbi:MAG: putative PEP-binding protein, partial [Chloroflexota bacterium]
MADLELNGLPAAPGLAVGPAWEHRLAPGAAVPVPDIVAAAGLAATELDRIADTMRAAGHPDEADILGAQALMALDPMLLDAATDAAAAEGATEPGRLAQLVETSAATSARMLAALTDPLLAARATDVRDVGARIARIITGQALILPTRPSIAVAQDLPPSVTAEIPRALLLGIALEGGSPVSHAAILARGFGIPAIVAVPGLLEAVGEAGRAKNDVEVALDGSAGVLIIDPSRARRTTLDRAEAARRERAAEVMKLRDLPGQTRDGRRVPLVANIGRPEDAERALSCGAEGVGLFRSEFLFLGRPDAPTEDEQAMAYATVLRAFGPDRPVVIRLADI